MYNLLKKISFNAILLLFVFSGLKCSVYETFVNVSRLEFKLGTVNSFMVQGIPVSGKSNISDFSPVDILKISASVVRGTLPVSFIVNVEAKNPNDGTGGYKRTDATIKSFPWRLFIDDKQIITGDIANPVSVPGTGEITNIPLSIKVDLASLFKEKGYESLVNLALNLGGAGGSASRITLYAKPTVTTALGNITYPEEIKIVDTQFSK